MVDVADLLQYQWILAAAIPELTPTIGFSQHSTHHAYDVWEHTIRAVENAPASETLRLTMLLHDSGKPAAFTVDEQGVGHMWGHQAAGAEIAREVLAALKPDNHTRDRVITLVANHTYKFKRDRRAMLRLLSGRDHQVMTGVTVLQDNKSRTHTEITEVRFRHLSAAEIEAYVATGEPLDKAGSYGIQGGAALFAEKMVGDYYNVMGLPVCKLWQTLRQIAPELLDA